MRSDTVSQHPLPTHGSRHLLGKNMYVRSSKTPPQHEAARDVIHSSNIDDKQFARQLASSSAQGTLELFLRSASGGGGELSSSQ